ncbi:LysR family transcriptional regulator [Rhodoferax sp. UBA5149]|uniref:LysR family transcriptional regulator n=1 Tax=Rhodoferax sp. UBA5149 TaxID=1947379 RepID=UPI0025F0B6DE|nr:LysR family transcriptional regulator [Rhodoferax sp. UBA5149]
MRNPLKLRQLKYFVAVAEELNFRRAAQRLFITQPPLSRQIKMLEDSLGAPLFERSRQGVRLTDAGTRFLSDARSLIREADQVLGRFEPQDAPALAELSVGITTVIDASLFAWVEAAFAQRFPETRLTVKRQNSSQCIRDLNRGTLDAAVIGLPSHAEGLTTEHLCDEPMVACIPASHAAAKKRQLSVLDLAQDSLFWFDRKLNPAYYNHCEKVFERLGFRPERVPEPSDHHVLLGLIANGQGVALIPRSLKAMTRKGIVYKSLLEGEQLRISVGVAYRVGEVSKTVAALIGLLKERVEGHA